MNKTVYNYDSLRDKILACWIGKNIGGTMGAPYEGCTDMQDITGYNSPKGEPLPNDDLDLQMAWFMMLERFGPKHFDANTLAECWQLMISPQWNEYGIGKKNLTLGLLPPLSGEFDNDKWKHSNGAWIRSEIWACLAPGYPNVAIKYAIMDACVDHGMGEGVYAEIFTAALESIAFVETDTRKIVETALTYIPESCRVSQSVRLVLAEYDKKTPYRDTRNLLVKANEDLGWFQAPANVAFVVIGLLYGEGDFKKSMIYTINCGDDTDCTGGTLGAILGIVGGTAGIPADWREYIGDRIMQVCINGHFAPRIPKTCTAFTDKILAMIPRVLEVHNVDASYGEEPCYNREEAFAVLEGYSASFWSRSRFSFDISDYRRLSATVEYEREPVIRPGESFPLKVTLRHLVIATGEIIHFSADLSLPQGWSADYRKNIYIGRNVDMFEAPAQNPNGIHQNEYTFTITAGEQVAAQNKLFLHFTTPMFAQPFTIPITLLG